MTKLNFTGRQRIGRSGVRLRVHGEFEDLRLTVDRLDIDQSGLPDDARVVVEAQRQTNYMRFECGRVAEMSLPSGVQLAEFDTPDGILFRIKVIGDEAEDHGKLLAVTDRLRATDDDATDGGTSASVPLLPFQAHDLDQVTWQLDVSGEHPVVLVNRRLPDWKAYVQSPEFRALVFPEVLRQVAQWILRQDIEDATPDDAAWPWKCFMELLHQSPIGVDDDKADDWAEELVHAFARRAGLFEGLAAATGWEGDE